jgi:methylglyoxal/glyoxal reductase
VNPYKLSVAAGRPLASGFKMPVLGLGVYLVPPGAPTRDAVSAALQSGYRLIDTAKGYQNEADVGQAIRESGIPRDDLFITTKLPNQDHGSERAIRSLESSRKALGVSFVDLYLIHWPVPGVRRATWKALERMNRDGSCRAIGVSNYTVRHLEELISNADIVPAVNQVELHPFLAQPELRDFCRKHRIQVEAYSPLVRGDRWNHPTIRDIAVTHGRTPAQVLLRWGVQHDVVEIPKSVHPERIAENAAVFDFSLSSDEMRRLDSLDARYHTCWDPTDEP